MVVFELPGGAPVYGFSLLAAMGAVLGLGWSVWQAPEEQRWAVVEAGLWALVGALLASRVVYAALNWEYFRIRPWEILLVYQGGLSWAGALAGGLLGLGLYASAYHTDAGQLADHLAPLLGALTAGAWLGCWLAGCAYGPIVSGGWVAPAVDEWGQVARRWPLQLAAAALTLGWFWLLDRLPGGLRPGLRGGLALLGVALVAGGAALLRSDAGLEWRSIRLDAWGALAFAGLALVFLGFFMFRKRREKYR